MGQFVDGSRPMVSRIAPLRNRLLSALALAALLLAVTPAMHLRLAVAGGTQTPPTDPIPQSATYGGFDPVAPNLGVCSAADPVECSDGDFYQTFSLISIPGRGVPLQLSLTYNSALASQGSQLGYGWDFSYGMTLSQSGSSVTITSRNGATVTFSQSGSTFTPPTWAQASLVRTQGAAGPTPTRTTRRPTTSRLPDNSAPNPTPMAM